jgi:pSer/pThr/pTyr-binding forkhead associated (FHA) protein
VSKKLVVSDGTRERELQLVGRIVVGRDPACDISHEHSLLSRRHAEFVAAGELVVVRDLGSRNGVFVNGTKTAEHSLQPGDVVQIGPLRAQYVVDRAPLSISPEDHDAERTKVIHAMPPAIAATPVAAPAADAEEEEDEEATRLISSRPQAEPATPRPPAEDSDATRFIPAPLQSHALSEAPTGEVLIPRRPEASLRPFIFLQLLVFGGLVLIAAVLFLRVDGASAPLTALVVPVVVAVVGGYLVSGVIDRRFAHALADERNRD